MARIQILTLVLAGLLIGLEPHQAEGQSIPSPYRFFETRQEAGLFAGYSSQGTGRFGYGPAAGPSFGARYAIHLGGAFGLEGVLGYQPTTRDVVDPTRVEGDMVVGSADATIMSADVRLRFSLTGDRSWRRLNPFIFMGGGMAWDAAGAAVDDAKLLDQDQFQFGVKLVALLGTGIRWFPTKRLLLRTDLGVTMNQLKTPKGFLDPARALKGVGEKEWVSGPIFSVGAAFHF